MGLDIAHKVKSMECEFVGHIQWVTLLIRWFLKCHRTRQICEQHRTIEHDTYFQRSCETNGGQHKEEFRGISVWNSLGPWPNYSHIKSSMQETQSHGLLGSSTKGSSLLSFPTFICQEVQQKSFCFLKV